ncbi:MAG: branched-chain amino acid ABC transporter substrate-binding protein [Ramlibacter sp.]|nr:branched-chain amino acid ABC transporter substrate-binding protein [Ramlibacter sp.]
MHTPTRRHAVTSVLALGVVAAAGLLAGCDNVPSTIKIGVAQPMSGNLAALGQDMFNGVKLAVDELNKDGFKIKGKPVKIEIVAVDDRASSTTGKEVAQQLIDAGVVAVIGHLNSGVSIDTAPLYAGKHIAQLAISTNPKYTELGFDTTFRLVANDTLQAKAIGSFAGSQLKGSKFAVVDDGTPYGKGLADGAAAQLKKANKTIALRQSFDDKTTAFDELAGKLKEGGVEAIVSTLNDFQVLALIDALKKVDYTTVSLLGGDTIKTTAMLKGAGVLQGGLYATSPILDAREFPSGAKFLDSYRAAFKVDPAYGGHYSYDAMYVLAGAIKRAESAKPEAITSALHTIDGYAPVTGSMKFDAKGEQRYGVISVYATRNGGWESQLRSDAW